MPRTGEDLKIDIERAAKGESFRDRETGYILMMRKHSLSWTGLMDIPYRILIKMNMLTRAESLLGGRHGN